MVLSLHRERSMQYSNRPVKQPVVSMEKQQERQEPFRKRYFSHLQSSASDQRPAKQRKHGATCMNGEKGSDKTLMPNNDDHDSQKNGLLRREPDDEIRGMGTRNDPILFPTWETGNVISSKYHGTSIELSDDEDEGSKNLMSRMTIRDLLKNYGSDLIAGKGTEQSIRKTTSLMQGKPYHERKTLPLSVDGKSFARKKTSLTPLTRLLLSPSVPSPAPKSAFTKPTSTASPPQDKTLVRNENELLKNPNGLVKIEKNGLEDSDDDFVDDPFLDSGPSVNRKTRDTSGRGASKQTRTNGWRKQPATEDGKLLYVSSVQHPDVDEDDKDDCVSLPEQVMPTDSRQPSWSVHRKSEEEGNDDVPGFTLSQDTTASGASGHDDLQDDLFHTKRAATAAHAISRPTTLEVSHSHVSQEPVRVPKDIDVHKMPLATRKKLFFNTYYPIKRARLEKTLQRYYFTIQSDLSLDGCWLYTGRRMPKPPSQGLKISFTFRHNGRSEPLTLHPLVVRKLLDGTLSQEQIDGFVNHSWHASHLCGNWTCLNTTHVIAEPGSINLNRNLCFKDVNGPCLHVPKCLKHLKLDKNLLQPTTGTTSLEDDRVK